MRHRDFTHWPTVEGYVAEQSIVAGETVVVHCSSREPGVDVKVVRVGAERTAVWSAQVGVGDYATPDDAWRLGCDWPKAFEIVTFPLDEVPRLIRDGAITHSLVIAAFYRMGLTPF